MAYYILYPKDKRKNVRVVVKRPVRAWKNYGFAEGPLSTIKAVKQRLNAMNISNFNRPKKFMSSGID